MFESKPVITSTAPTSTAVAAVRALPGAMKPLTGAYVTSGVIHLVKPQVFLPLVPAALSARKELVYLSGVAELVCAAALLTPSLRRPAGWASAALLVAVWPGNIQMALDLDAKARRRPTAANQVARVGGWLRVAGQVPLIRASIAFARSSH